MDNIILWIMAIAMVLGALDRMFGSRLGLGKQFEEGILAIGALSLSMLGILTLAPVLARLLRPVLVPVYGFLGADPAMFAGSILANDMGGAPLAMELAGTRAAGQLGGLIVGSMLGATVVFSIPVALGILQPEDRPALARGVLAGLLAIAPGAFAGGLAAGFPLGMLVRNLVPIVLFAVLIALGLWRWERAMIRGFLWFGRGVLAVITVGLAAAVFTELTGVTVIPGTAPLEGGVQTVAGIGFVLAGAFPLVFLLTKLLRRPLAALGRLLGNPAPSRSSSGRSTRNARTPRAYIPSTKSCESCRAPHIATKSGAAGIPQLRLSVTTSITRRFSPMKVPPQIRAISLNV